MMMMMMMMMIIVTVIIITYNKNHYCKSSIYVATNTAFKVKYASLFFPQHVWGLMIVKKKNLRKAEWIFKRLNLRYFKVMQNIECIIFDRTRDTELRIHEPCASLWVPCSSGLQLIVGWIHLKHFQRANATTITRVSRKLRWFLTFLNKLNSASAEVKSLFVGN